jgi:carotenoid cleavage dioxygenase-like enzyme
MRAFGAIACFFAPVLASGADIGWELIYTSAGPDVPRTCFDVPNLHPPEEGAFFIGGPAQYEMGGYTFQSYFDGYGKYNRFELSEGKVCWTAKYMNTSYYKEALLLGRPAEGEFMGTDPPLPHCPFLHPLCKAAGGPQDNNWVNILPSSTPGEGLLLTDSPIFVRFNYETMDTLGEYHWKDSAGGIVPKFLKQFHMPATGSAHPVRRPKTENTWVEIMLEVGLTQALAVYTIDTSTMDRELLAHVPMKGFQYFHSFGVSENYVVLPCNLALGGKGSSMNHGIVGGFGDGWDGIHLVDKDGNIQVFDTHRFFHVHIANTFENESGVVLDLGTFDHVPFNAHTLETKMVLNKTERDRAAGTKVERIHLHLAGPLKGQVTREILSVPGRQVDFFKINHHVWGLPYCIYYGVEWFHNDQDYASMAILKHNVCDGTKTYWNKTHTYLYEPYFLPKGSGTTPDVEDDGLLFFVTVDGIRKASNFVILDGKTLQEIAVVELPVHIPFLAHGQFIAKARDALEAGRADLSTVVDAITNIV